VTRCIRVQKWLWCTEISKIDLSYISETLRDMCPIVNHVWTFFTKTIYFYGNIMDKYMFPYHLNKLTKIWYYCYYYVVIWRKKVWIVPKKQFNFSSISRIWTITYEPSCNFSAIFCILLDAHVVQYCDTPSVTIAATVFEQYLAM
jgi:hypothetical protein